MLRRLLLLLLLVGGAGPLPAPAQIFKLPLPDTTAGNFFGGAVSLSGDLALVGASGVDTCGENAGAAYIYARNPEKDVWHLQARLTPSDCQAGHFFGRAVALSGRRAAVAAFRPFFSRAQSNAVYVFEQDSLNGEWVETARLTAETGLEEGAFGTSVALDSDRLLVTTSGDVADGRYGGAAYVFERRPDGRWVRTARLTGSAPLHEGIFGTDGALDGDRLVVAASTYFAYRPGSLYVFERDATTGRWRETAHLTGLDDFFITVDLDGDRILAGESKYGDHDEGRASVFERDAATGRWRRTATLRPAQPYRDGAFGAGVALSGDRALVVGYDEQLSFDFNVDRVVFVFAFDPGTGTWQQTRLLDVGAWAFGAAVDLEGPMALVGEASEQQPGRAYIIRLP